MILYIYIYIYIIYKQNFKNVKKNYKKIEKQKWQASPPLANLP